ncbi:variable surface lipoprotein, partial [Mycoplasmopsis bovis]|uniref:variable surface lipoprotein n=1 Tax=Mycoplasmopsis bovis TaxID=28903 RepID=UPI003D289903
MASIPFVAAKCGETKEEKKPEEGKNPGGNTEPGVILFPGFISSPDFASISNLRVTSPSKSLAETVTLFLLKSAFNFNSLSFSVGTFVTIASLIATSIFSLLLLSCSST